MGIIIEIHSDKSYEVDFDLPPGVNPLDAVRILGDAARRYIQRIYPPELQDKALAQVMGELMKESYNGNPN